MCALLSAFWFRLFLPPSSTRPFTRHLVRASLPAAERTHLRHHVADRSPAHAQISRVYVFDYGMYSADFTGRMPSPLEYFSYNCNFLGILAGPTCSYTIHRLHRGQEVRAQRTVT
ncbi:hypothetical protein F7725_028364 [Dissostichus mawsoni]|uniref:Secreted protein n=1 Tax=Dissostichus mawsoni TaxID=36200 RepID=A0A7J5XFG6_DISMA|nr:hypothetical protein F7725_028364 [Dissostichus mawsoni]